MADDLKATITNLKYSSNKVNTTLDELQKAIEGTRSDESIAGVLLSDSISATKLKNIIQNLETSSVEINRMTQNLNAVVEDINKGEGMLRMVATDTAMAHHLMKTMQNIEEGTEKFNENMEALKHNFLTRGYFRKLEKEQKKANDQKE